MEVYTLDAQLRRIQVIDEFESLIWTERFAEWGEFDLTVESTPRMRQLLTSGQKLAMNESLRVMTVETREISTDSDGRKFLHVTGRSIEAILEDRVLYGQYPFYGSYLEYFELTDTPGNIIRYIFTYFFLSPIVGSYNVIPYAEISSELFPVENIDEPSSIIVWRQEPIDIYSAVKDLCEKYALGFRFVRNYDNSELHFNVYAGSDRRTGNGDFPPLQFSPDFENLENSKEFTSTQTEKNTAYVLSTQGGKIVYAPNVDPLISGFARKAMVVNVGNIDIPDGYTAAQTELFVDSFLEQRGLEALAQQRATYIFDGEIRQDTMYRYGVDYYLGDVVELRGEDQTIASRRVTEQIFVSDQEGERSYPTLSEDPVFTAGTWAVADGDLHWADFTTEVWADL